jgi:hypothetical protein
MTSEQILDWQTEDPKGYYANILEQAKHEVAQTMRADLDSRSIEDAVVKTYEKYAAENPDFDELWDSGELRAFMDKNPGHNAISAHMALTNEKKAKEAIDKAVADAEKRIMDNFKAKRESKVLGSGPSAARKAAETETSAELKDTKKHGGLMSVLTRRSLARDKERFGG